MLISLKWLNQYVKVDDYDENELANLITNAGLEVEGIYHLGQATNLCVGYVKECYDHPDSDHLHCTKVDIGSEVLNIVCGAPNCRAGLKVIVAKDGAVLPGGTIKKGVIRGQESNGMLCSLLELGIEKNMLPDGSTSLDGIEELDDSFTVGQTDILEQLGYIDTILDASPTPNRSDCLSMWGVAKEVGAILDRPVTIPWDQSYSKLGEATKLRINSESKNCPHFLGKVIGSVKLGPSPKWMSEHLHAAGIKSINNIVDISNYVMVETGQPLHFYDIESNPDLEITVKDNYTGGYTALDGIEYQLQDKDMVITTGGQVAGIAGIMGGDNTKILDTTKGIIIECASFNYAQIRHTSNRLGLQTEAALRYAKGLDPLAQEKAMDRAVELLVKYADAKEIEATVEYGHNNYQQTSVTETLSHLNGLLGTSFSLDATVDVLRRLDFKPQVDGENITCTIPSYRSNDIKQACDIDEEVIRLIGFDDLPTTLPVMPATIGKLTKPQALRRNIRSLLTSNGLDETVTYTLIDKFASENGAMPLGDCVAVASPLSEDHKYVRNSLMTSMLSVVAYNLNHYNKDVNLFEISCVYSTNNIDFKPEGPHHVDDENPWKMQERLGIVLNGNLQTNPLSHCSVKTDFYTLKGLLYSLLDKVGYDNKRVQLRENIIDTEHFHPYQSACLYVNNKLIAIFGAIHPNLAKHYDIKDVYYAELNMDSLIDSNPSSIRIANINKYPTISRDISIVVKDEIKANDLITSVKRSGGKLVSSVTVFDIYKGEHVEKGYKSMSLSIVYESSEHTLKDSDINPIHEKILADLNNKYQANLRQ